MVVSGCGSLTCTFVASELAWYALYIMQFQFVFVNDSVQLVMHLVTTLEVPVNICYERAIPFNHFHHIRCTTYSRR